MEYDSAMKKKTVYKHKLVGTQGNNGEWVKTNDKRLHVIWLHLCNFFKNNIYWHESSMDLHVLLILISPPASISIPFLWVFPVHQPWALVSCIQPGLVICFTFDSILVSMLFSQNIPPSPSPTESKSLFCISVSLFLFCI